MFLKMAVLLHPSVCIVADPINTLYTGAVDINFINKLNTHFVSYALSQDALRHIYADDNVISKNNNSIVPPPPSSLTKVWEACLVLATIVHGCMMCDKARVEFSASPPVRCWARRRSCVIPVDSLLSERATR